MSLLNNSEPDNSPNPTPTTTTTRSKSNKILASSKPLVKHHSRKVTRKHLLIAISMILRLTRQYLCTLYQELVLVILMPPFPENHPPLYLSNL